jgi:hypothetical protein
MIAYKYRSRLVINRFSTRISGRAPHILTEVFRGLPQSLQDNAGIVLCLKHESFKEETLYSSSYIDPSIIQPN